MLNSTNVLWRLENEQPTSDPPNKARVPYQPASYTAPTSTMPLPRMHQWRHIFLAHLIIHSTVRVVDDLEYSVN